MGHVHRGGLDGQGDDVAAVLGRLGARWDGDARHPAAVGVAQDATLVLAVKAFTGIWEETERDETIGLESAKPLIFSATK